MSLLVIGYGNRLRGDDAAGPVVADRLAARGIHAIAVHQLTPELAELVAAADQVVFVDAAVDATGCERVEPVAGRAPLHHVRAPAEVLHLAEAVYGRCPPAWLVRVSAVSFEFGAGMSAEARRGCRAAERTILQVVAEAHEYP